MLGTGTKGLTEPIPRPQLDLIMQSLESQERWRDLMLFKVLSNSGLRISDVLPITVGDLKAFKLGTEVQLREGKTGKSHSFTVNQALADVAGRYLQAHPNAQDHECVLASRKGRNRPITRQTAWCLIKTICRQAGVQVNSGCHSLRKTLARSAIMDHGVPIEVVSEMMGHSSPAVTRRYACITRDDIKQARLKVGF